MFGLDDQIVQAVVDDYARSVGRGRVMTADLCALYPRETEDRAVLRPLTRNRSVAPYERARLAAGALAARFAPCGMRGFSPRPYAVSVTVASRSHPRPFRSGLEDGRLLEAETGVDTVEQTCRL